MIKICQILALVLETPDYSGINCGGETIPVIERYAFP